LRRLRNEFICVICV